jgi:L-malate glycosyltransferase
MKRILIAHQSTIPHYRIPFYELLQKQMPDKWSYEVVFDPSQANLASDITLNFPLLRVKTKSFTFKNRPIIYQTFLRQAADYDLLIVENAVNNLTYPLAQLHQLHGVKFAYWGHGRDLNATKISGWKGISEKVKIWLAHRADGFFAYTQGVKAYLEKTGLPSQKIHVVNNTIDIKQQRDNFQTYSPHREQIKTELGVANKKVLLFVGRFTSNKRLDFLLEAFAQLQKQRDDFHLLLVGNGELPPNSRQSQNISFLGPITNLYELGPIYVASDLFVFPGAVGLGPLQALCYNLPTMTIASPYHKPEYDYLLDGQNAIILKQGCTPSEYACALLQLFEQPGKLYGMQQTTWGTISHLTIEQMVINFIEGINCILDL